METTPEEEGNPVLVAFKKITTQLEQLEEREKRAEVREREAEEHAELLIEQHNKVSMMMLKIVEKADNFQQNMDKVETRTKSYLSNYFKELPKNATVVNRKEWSIERNTKVTLLVMLFLMLISGLFVYFASPQVDIIRMEYQAQKINELEAKLNYMEAKNPKTARNYEAEKDK
jgi:hypothetical protein